MTETIAKILKVMETLQETLETLATQIENHEEVLQALARITSELPCLKDLFETAKAKMSLEEGMIENSEMDAIIEELEGNAELDSFDGPNLN